MHADQSYVYPNDYLIPGQEIIYSLKVYNDGNDNAKNTIIKDILPENVVFSKESIVLPSKKIKVRYDEESRALSFDIPNKMVKTNSQPFEIRYNVVVNTSCESIDGNGEALIVDQPVSAEFNGSLNETRKYTKGFNHINKCNAPDFYRMKLAVDMSGMNCPNFIKYASAPKKDLDTKIKELSDADKTNNTETAGINEEDITQNSINPNPSSGLKSDSSINKTISDLIDLNEIYFEFDKWDITPRAEVELNKIVELMTKDRPNMVIKIETHSDSRGDHDYNLNLSHKRAESIYNYLVSQNISKNRILSYNGYGETKPVNDCLDGKDCSEEEYQLNRRSNFVIME
nr:OmpA family protein [Aquimarina sp. MMG016]